MIYFYIYFVVIGEKGRNMLKVFLVEDEFVVREGIKNNVDWESHGYEFCGEASDGELAFSMIQKVKPDIVITDIKMPFMDGLTLSKLIKKELPATEIIILTGFEEFEYAKEAIKIGVAQYLSKPINGDELLKEVDAIAAKIKEKREVQEKYLREMEEDFAKERKQLFRELVLGEKSVAELLEMAAKLNIDLSSLWYNVVLVKTQSMRHSQDEYSDSLVKIENALKELEETSNVLVFDRNLEGKALIFKADSKEELETYQMQYIEKMKDIFERYGSVRYFGGIGVPVERLREISSSFEKASRAFAHQYLMTGSFMLDSKEIEQKDYLQKEDFNFSAMNAQQVDRDKIVEFLKLGDRAEVVYFVTEFFKGLGTDAMESNIFRNYIVMDTYFCVMKFLEEQQLSKEGMEELDMNSETLQTKEKSIEFLMKIIDKAVELRENNASNRYGDILDQVMQYIDENYAKEELSLNMLAAHVNFSPNHLSMIFSQQTGQTFIKYLTNYRMNKAKELLRCTGKRSSVISAEVGYKDPHYFSYLFKKTQGMTPTQYRGGKSTEGEE